MPPWITSGRSAVAAPLRTGNGRAAAAGGVDGEGAGAGRAVVREAVDTGCTSRKLRRRRLRNRRLAGRAVPRDEGPGAVPSSPRAWTVRPWGRPGIADTLGAAAGRPRRATAATPTMHVEGPVMTATVETSTSTRLEPWRAFTGGTWRDGNRRGGLHPGELHAVRRRRPTSWPARPSAPPTLWERLEPRCSRQERERGIYDVDAGDPVHASPRTRPGYIDRDRELIVGLQTDAPLQAGDHAERRAADGRDRAAGVRLRARPDRHARSSPSTARPTTTACSTPTPPQMLRRAARPASSPGCPTRTAAAGSSATTGGCALYGVDRLIEAEAGRQGGAGRPRRSTDDVIRDREELAEQIRALGELDARWRRPTAATSPGPPRTAQEAVQWLYFGLPRRHQGAERRGDVAGPHLHVPRRLPRSATSPRARSTRPAPRSWSTTS